jgi:hypothetical protein
MHIYVYTYIMMNSFLREGLINWTHSYIIIIYLNNLTPYNNVSRGLLELVLHASVAGQCNNL